ncbi:MAG: FAD-binding protein [Armatimonadota bacterium]
MTAPGNGSRPGNWSGTVDFPARRWEQPSADAVSALLAGDDTEIRPLGTAHSFSAIARTRGLQIATGNMDRILSLDESGPSVLVEPGVTYAALGEWLHARGWALSNLASLPHLSVGGAVATGTHGSGDRNGSLATAVLELEIALPGGGVVRLNRDEHPDVFPGAVVSLGALGVVRSLRLRIVPTFTVRQTVYEDLSLDAYLWHFDDIHRSAYSVSVFTDWSPGTVAQVWRKCVVSDPVIGDRLFGAPAAPRNLHPIRSMDASRCTPQMGEEGPWHLRLPHFLPEFAPSHGDEIQSEYFVPRVLAPSAIEAVAAIGPRLQDLLWISEIRTVAADDLWMSPACNQDVVGIHFTWRRDPERVSALLATVEELLAPYGARPHWGKVFRIDPSPCARHESFRALALRFDPERRMRNAFLDRILERGTGFVGL